MTASAPDILYIRPIMELGTAVGVLSRAVPSITESQIRQLIERGAICAWDFSASRRRGRKPFLRLLSRSVAALDYPALSRLLADPYHIPAPNPPTPREAVAAILNHLDPRPHVSGPQLSRVFGIRRTSLRRLIDSGALPEAPRTHRRPGPGGSPLFTLRAVQTFLETRLLV